MESSQPQTTVRVLVIEDNDADARLITEILREVETPRFVPTFADRLSGGITCLERETFDVALLDLELPDTTGIDTFARLHFVAPHIPTVVLTSLDDKEFALKAVQHGAQDYLVKGSMDGPLLTRALLYAIERERLSTEIQRQARQLERDKTRAQFVEIMAHELRNPMSVVKAILTLLRVQVERGGLPQNATGRILTAEREVDRVSALLTEVLDAFRMDKGQLDLSVEHVDLVDVARSALWPFQMSEEERSFSLEHDQPEVFTTADARRIEQVVRNLLENAIKYSPPQSQITVRVQGADGRARISVSDQGPGIPEDQIQQIFDGFYRATNVTARDLGGLGLGLFICKAIVEQHGGSIWAENGATTGATFYVELAETEAPPRSVTG